MANERYPNDPYRANDLYRASDPYRPVDPTRPEFDADAPYRRNRLESDLQADRELAEGSASAGKVALFVLAIAVLLGAVFYGLNNSSMRPSGTTSTTQTTAPATARNTGAPTSPPTAPPGMRDAIPRPNAGPGVTTGAAPSQPQPPASTDPANNIPARK